MKKIILISLFSIISFLFSPIIAVASNKNNDVNTDTLPAENIEFVVNEYENEVLITDREASISIKLEILNNYEVRVSDSYGNTDIVNYDDFGNAYLGDKKIYESSVEISEVPILISDDIDPFNSLNNTWIFDYEYTGHTAVMNPIEQVARTIIGFIPVIGDLVAIVDVVETFMDYGYNHLYFISQVFRNADWSLYRVVTYFYSDSQYRNHVTTHTNLHQIPVGANSIEN